MSVGLDGFLAAIEALFEQYCAFETTAVADGGVRSGRHLFAQEIGEAGRIPGSPEGLFEADARGLGIGVDVVDRPVGACRFPKTVELFEQVGRWLGDRFPNLQQGLRAQTMGEEKPLCWDPAESCWQSNRRVEIEVEPSSTSALRSSAATGQSSR